MIIANVFPDDTDDSSDDRLETSIMGLIVESTRYANMRFRVSAYHHVHMKSERICDKNWEKKESLRRGIRENIKRRNKVIVVSRVHGVSIRKKFGRLDGKRSHSLSQL